MHLKDYIPKLGNKFKKINFSGISFDSSKVKKDNIFFAIKGNKTDGNEYIDNAIQKGAKIIITEKKIPKKKDGVIYLYTSNVRKLLSEVSYKLIKKRPKKLIAVTGTNGKSSIAEFYFQILDLNSKKVASIGTIGLRSFKNKKTLANTTLDPIQTSLIFKELKRKKVDYIIMEASSHGLKQNRLDGLLFDIGIFSNLSHDHLDYHKSMKNYLESKLYLFNKLIKKRGNIITDASIPQIKKIKNIANTKKINLNLILDETKGIDVISHSFIGEKQFLIIKYNNKEYETELNLIGKIQIKNILMSIIAAHKSGLKFQKIIDVIKEIRPVEGRLEKIGKVKNNSRVILDYAHTPAALETALLNLKEQFPSSRLILVFGCGGNRDFKKRPLMGKIAEKYSDKIYLTDDNPRSESPSKIRYDIKKGIKKTKVEELPDRKKAINDAIMSLNTGDVLLVAGKGHEKIQDYGKKQKFFSDKKIILSSIKFKNKYLSENLKLNIIKEQSQSSISNKFIMKNVSINSKEIKKNDIFFAIKGERIDGNKFVQEAFKNGCSLSIVNKINRKYPLSKQIKVKNTLDFLTRCSSILRENISAKIISITGSCGKTTLKDMLSNTLNKISKTSYSPKSFNNKYGVPLSLFNLKNKDLFGVFEVGMDKKGEINNLTKIIKPDVGIITNISYAHSKNFKNIKQIADAKAEIMNNIKNEGTIILNMDDKFYNYLKNKAIKKNLKVINFSIKNKNSFIKIIKIKKDYDKFNLSINVNGLVCTFYSYNKNKSNLYNILASLAAISLYKNVKDLKKDIFLNIKIPTGRGDVSKILFKNKKIILIDEAFNSNPLSLKTAIENYDKIESKNSKKYLVLGDMLELGQHSKKQHKLISKVVNKTKINQVYVIGKYIKETFKGLNKNKRGKILNSNLKILDLISNELKDNDYLMIKGSNSTGLHKITNDLKRGYSNAI